MSAYMLNAALRYARTDWHVFPVGRRTKAPLIGKDQGGNGVHDATGDEAQIREWWTRYPNANIGMAMGRGVWALDVDPRHNGVASLEALTARHGRLPATALQRTGSGGLHYLFRSDGRIKNRAGPKELGQGLDTRADGGYIIVAPSVHPETGAEYEWPAGLPDRWFDIAPAPDWLAALVVESDRPDPPKPDGDPFERQGFRSHGSGSDRYVLKALEDELSTVATAPEGARNATLNRGAFSLFRFVPEGRLPADIIVRGCIAAAAHAGLPETEARKTIASAARARGVQL